MQGRQNSTIAHEIQPRQALWSLRRGVKFRDRDKLDFDNEDQCWAQVRGRGTCYVSSLLIASCIINRMRVTNTSV